MRIPLPPIAEQHRLVSRIERLAARIEAAHALRTAAMKETAVLLSATLSAAYETLRQRLGVVRLDSTILEAGYGSSQKCHPQRTDHSTPVLRIPNVASERLDVNSLKFTELPSKDRERLMLRDGDILIVRTNGSADLVGRCAVVQTLPEPMAFASYLIRLRLDTAHILPIFAQKMLWHLRSSGQLIDFARTTAGQYNVSLGRLRSAEIPLPSLDEQFQIVTKLDALHTDLDVLKRLQSETKAKLETLLPAILQRAFTGEL
jgi:type I restriction enzyme S subunit